MLFAFAIFRGKSYSAEGSSKGRSSALDWFPNSQEMSQSLEAGLRKPFRPDRTLPPFARSCAVPPPPTDIKNLNLSQAFRTSFSSSEPAADAAPFDYSRNAEASFSSPFVSPYSGNVSRKENNLASSGPAVFKVPYRNARPIAKVSRQETAMNVADLRRQEAPVDAVNQQVDGATGLNAVDVVARDNEKGSRKPTASEDSCNVIVKTPQSQPICSGLRDFAAATPFSDVSVVHSTTNVRHHVGDTPLALSGFTIQ